MAHVPPHYDSLLFHQLATQVLGQRFDSPSTAEVYYALVLTQLAQAEATQGVPGAGLNRLPSRRDVLLSGSAAFPYATQQRMRARPAKPKVDITL